MTPIMRRRKYLLNKKKLQYIMGYIVSKKLCLNTQMIYIWVVNN